MDDCVAKVEAQGHDKENAVAICYASIVEGKAIDLAIEEQHLGALKVGARTNADDRRRVREIRKHAGEINSLTKELEPNDDDQTTMDRITGKADLETEGGDPIFFTTVKAAGDWELDVLGVPYGGPHNG